MCCSHCSPERLFLATVSNTFVHTAHFKGYYKKATNWSMYSTDNIELNRISDCKFYFMQEVKINAKVMDYTPVRSLGFLNVCMLGKQFAS
jgi:hypothetical protein